MPVQAVNNHAVITPDFISRAVDEVRRLKPDYGLLLGLYEKIFVEQENARSGIDLADYVIPDEVLSAKAKGQFPLVTIPEFIIDEKSAGALLAKICEILAGADDEISGTAKKIGGAVESKRIIPADLFPAFLSENDAVIKSIGNEFDIDATILDFVVYNSLKPSLVEFAGMMSRYLNTDNEWDRGYCPVCGSMPELSIFEENGKRSLLCGFCGHRWNSKRVFCPFCENTDHETLRYFEIEDEEEYRVEVCDKCKRFIKTVNTQKLSRPVYLPLECIATPYIDVRFDEMGYRNGNVSVDR
ncbi:MAG: formate dehydrogenase accessory protein FdhE [Spirochaetes bacterium]|nr:formate dehydrogenase accessory protein FdhE [Spirochaetota bacterium]